MIKLDESVVKIVNELDDSTKQSLIDKRKAQMDLATQKYAKALALSKSHAKANLKPAKRSKQYDLDLEFVKPWRMTTVAYTFVDTSSEQDVHNVQLFEPDDQYDTYNLFIDMNDEPDYMFDHKPSISELENVLSKYYSANVTLPPENDDFRQLGSNSTTSIEEAESICKEIIGNLERVGGGHAYKDHLEVDKDAVYWDIRDFGEWGTSKEWEDDDDQMEIHEDSYELAEKIITAAQNKYPAYNISWNTGEKRYINVSVSLR